MLTFGEDTAEHDGNTRYHTWCNPPIYPVLVTALQRTNLCIFVDTNS